MKTILTSIILLLLTSCFLTACDLNEAEHVHSVVIDEAVAPTCTKTGLTQGKHCSVCNKILVKQNTVAALGHTGVVDAAVAPTCTKTGLTQGKHCSVCNKILVKQDTIDASHNYTYEKFTASTTENSKTVYHCTSCADTYTIEWDNDLVGCNLYITEISFGGLLSDWYGFTMYDWYSGYILFAEGILRDFPPIDAKIGLYFGDTLFDSCYYRVDPAVGFSKVSFRFPLSLTNTIIQVRIISDEIPSDVITKWEYSVASLIQQSG